MHTTLDIPDDLLRHAETTAAERGTDLRQFVINALQREIGPSAPRPRRRLTTAPVHLASDAPLRTLSPTQIKAMDAAVEAESDLSKADALPR